MTDKILDAVAAVVFLFWREIAWDIPFTCSEVDIHKATWSDKARRWVSV